jgi:hypothetical protein
VNIDINGEAVIEEAWIGAGFDRPTTQHCSSWQNIDSEALARYPGWWGAFFSGEGRNCGQPLHVYCVQQ